MENIIVCNTSNDSLSKVDIDRVYVDTLPLKLGGEKIGPRSIDIKGERGVVVNCYSESITFVDIKNLKEIENYSVGKYPKDIKWRGENIYVACGDSNSIIIFNEVKKTIEFEIKVGDYPSSLAIDEKEEFIYIANSNSSSISIINNRTKKVEREIFLKEAPTKVELSKANNELLVCVNSFKQHMKGKLITYSLEDFKIKEEYRVGAFPIDLIESENLIYVANFGEGSISVINRLDKSSYKIMVGGMPKGLLKKDENLIISDYYKGKIILLNEQNMDKKIIAVGNEPNAMIFENLIH
ncbi:MAG: YncE family protein [Clostridium sp.]|uniref:YncE family protein n=1 Tax=Clostridium sp. TaxID=1506 RepID=UPI003EE7B329